MQNLKILLLIMPIIILSCSAPSLQDILVDKIETFSSYEEAYFKNIGIRTLARNTLQKEPLPFEVIKKGKPGNAIIETKPKLRIVKNFYTDSLSFEFVRVFGELDVRNLYNFDNGEITISNNQPATHLEFILGENRVFLFRNQPFMDPLSSNRLISESIRIDEDWRYAMIPLSND